MVEKPRHLPAAYRNRLARYAEVCLGMIAGLSDLSDDELKGLRKACEACSETNCGWSQYEAAKFLLPHIAAEMLCRKRMRKTG